MEEKDIKFVRKRIKRFLREDSKILEIDYTGKALNASNYYHSIIFANPLKTLFKTFIMSLCYFMPAGESKNSLYRLLGMKIGRQVFISGGVTLDVGFPELITIEDGAVIGLGATILTHESTISKIRIGKVRIGKRAVVGINSMIRAGVTIGNNSAAAIGAIVVSDVKDNQLVAGIPAKVIKKLSNFI